MTVSIIEMRKLRNREVNPLAKDYAVTSYLDRSAWSRMPDCNVPAPSCFQKSKRVRIMSELWMETQSGTGPL